MTDEQWRDIMKYDGRNPEPPYDEPADAIRDAEHRVAEAALKGNRDPDGIPWWSFESGDAADEFETAVSDLRRLKGEG